jgi:hypothetical protein
MLMKDMTIADMYHCRMNTEEAADIVQIMQ